MPETIYTPRLDTDRMRQDAMRRARDMYARARPQPQEHAEPAHSPAPPIQQAAQPEPEQEQIAPLQEAPESKIEKSPDFLETFFKDKEKMLILALLVILSQEENADNGLLFSLMFLLI